MVVQGPCSLPSPFPIEVYQNNIFCNADLTSRKGTANVESETVSSVVGDLFMYLSWCKTLRKIEELLKCQLMHFPLFQEMFAKVLTKMCRIHFCPAVILKTFSSIFVKCSLSPWSPHRGCARTGFPGVLISDFLAADHNFQLHKDGQK